jgi:hypothetical protein
MSSEISWCGKVAVVVATAADNYRSKLGEFYFHSTKWTDQEVGRMELVRSSKDSNA